MGAWEVTNPDAALLRTRREMTGASLYDMADLLDTRHQNYSRFEREAKGGGNTVIGPVPDYVWEQVDKLTEWIDRRVAEILATARATTGTITLHRWRTVDNYRADCPDAAVVPYPVFHRAVGLALDELLAEGRDVTMFYLDPPPGAEV